jgi:hypothetical protein
MCTKYWPSLLTYEICTFLISTSSVFKYFSRSHPKYFTERCLNFWNLSSISSSELRTLLMLRKKKFYTHGLFRRWYSGLIKKVNLSLCFNWAPHHGGVLGEWRCSSIHTFTSALDGGEWSASRPGRFTSRERAPGTHWIGGWVGSRAVVKRKIPSPRRESNPRTPIVQPVAQRYTDCATTALFWVNMQLNIWSIIHSFGGTYSHQLQGRWVEGRWRKNDPPRHSLIIQILHSILIQKNNIWTFITVKASNLTWAVFVCLFPRFI